MLFAPHLRGKYMSAPTLVLTEGTITAAQLLSAHSSPIQLLAAPGAGMMNKILSAVFHFKPGNTNYTGAADLYLTWGTKVSLAQQVFDSAALDNSTDEIDDVMPSATSESETNTSNDYVNKAVNLYATTNPGSGNGTITYSIVSYVANL